MNLLSSETSPYLRQHAGNPVHWMPWGDAAFARAAAENKPVLLSVGYAIFHWCHVMAHESFDDPALAAKMNDGFINIKVDREERPDLDHLYQQALALLGQQGGWPLTMFLTPDGWPFWGGTYFPPAPAHGLPGFGEVLDSIRAAWAHDGGKITHNTEKITAALAGLQQPVSGDAPDMRKSAATLIAATDAVHGGFAGEQKFPCLPLFDFLWAWHIRHDDADAKTVVVDALLAMCGRGLYDHAGGGFFRYAVDAAWQMPHFEKMLNDQALFLSLLSEVARDVPHPLFLSCIRETADFLQRDMATAEDNGIFAFASSLDADHDGQEGGYYLLPDGSHADAPLDADTRRQILDARRAGTPPARDDKIMADANGRAISGLVAAWRVLRDPALLSQARQVFDFICSRMMAADNRLSHSWCDGRRQDAGFADDYIQMGDAASALYQATGETRYLTAARRWAQILVEDYGDADTGGFFTTTAAMQPFNGMRIKSGDDTAVASVNGAAAAFLTTLHGLTGTASFRDTAEKTLRLYAAEAGRFPASHGSMLKAQLMASYPMTLAVPDDDAAAVATLLQRLSVPGLVIKPRAAQTILCAGMACFPPVADIDALETMLRRQRAVGRAANDG